MKLEELRAELPVRITEGYHGGKKGKVIAVGTFEGGPQQIGALVDIAEPGLVIVLPDELEKLPEHPLPPGWEEFEI